MPTLLIADCNEDFLLSLAEEVQSSYRVLTCRSGQKAMELLRREQPDIFVLDLMLPELDGLSVLETAAAEGIRPRILVVTTLFTDYVLTSASRLGIAYLIRKPCDIPAAAARIEDLSQTLAPPVSQPDTEARLQSLLHSLSLSAKHNGWSYLTKGIQITRENPNLSITKELYPAIAKAYGCKQTHVERSIRSALEAAWDRGDPKLWQSYFPGAQKRPSNAVFIVRMAEILGGAEE